MINKGITKKITHAFLVTFLLSGLIVFSSCNKDDDDNENNNGSQPEGNKSSGFIINTQTPNGDFVAKYFENLPMSSANVGNGGQTFQQFFPKDMYNGALFGQKTDGTDAFSKLVVNSEGRIEEEASTTTIGDFPFVIKVIDDSTGVFHDRASSTEISVFNPKTMMLRGVIDMSAGSVPSPQRFQDFSVHGDIVYAPLRPQPGGSYDELYVQSANYRTGEYLNTTQLPIGTNSPPSPFGQNYVDEGGVLYVPQVGDPLGGNPAGSIHRIPAGSNDLDPTYNFVPAIVANPANVLLPAMGGFFYIGNDLAVANVATDIPQELIDLVASVGGDPANLSPEQVQQALDILFAAENARWCELNMATQSVSVIDGIPAQSPFASSFVTEVNNEIYMSVTTQSVNAMYKYTPGSGSGSKAFDVTGGGSVVGFYDLSRNN
jgi:hypothetical protein